MAFLQQLIIVILAVMKTPALRIRKKEILMHAIIWMLVFVVPFLIRFYTFHSGPPPAMPGGFIRPDNYPGYFDLVFSSLLIICFYLNALVLIPKFIYCRKYGLFVVAHAVIFILFSIAGYLLINFAEKGFRPPVMLPFFPYVFILACSTTYKIVRDKFISDQYAKDKENENLKTELQLLRSQVSPHFMFNVLNTIVSMARLKSDELELTVIRLSSLMRYMLYDADEEKVELSKEIEYLRSYIELQQQRFEDLVDVNVSINVKNESCHIEPMLLIPFVENAFKHGTGYMDKAEINIVLMMEREELHLHVLNKYDPRSSEIKYKASGMGLANVKRRLKLLYENAHNLEVTGQNGWFNVLLTIKLTV